MARKYTIDGIVYLETAERKVSVGGKVLLETTAAPAGGDVLTNNYYRQFLLNGANF